jgi:hypothetical protein
MPISYELRHHVLDSGGAISIDEAKYAEYGHAHEVLLNALYIEEKLDLLLENFVEYEEALLSIGLSRMVFQRNDWTEFRNDISMVNRRLVNLLSACRAYLDQLPHHINEICDPSKNEAGILRRAMTEQYNSVFGYRVMEALRNYAQHRGSPFQSSDFSETCEWCGERQVKVFTVDPFLEPTRLSQDGEFKKAVLDEMSQRGEAVYLKPLVRQYISSIIEIHRQARDLVRDGVRQKRETIEFALEAVRVRDAVEKDCVSAFIIIADDGACTGRVCLSLESERRREILCKRSLCLAGLDHHFVSGVCRDDGENERDGTQQNGRVDLLAGPSSTR